MDTGSKTRQTPPRGFCLTHSQRVGAYACEQCRVFYCDACLAERNPVVMKCGFCDTICTNLKKAEYARANKKPALVGLDAGELQGAFAVREYSFYVMATCLGGLYVLSGGFFALTFLLLLGVLIHRVGQIYENKPFSKWFDFEFENWLNIPRSTASAILIFIICFAPLLVSVGLVLKGMPDLRNDLSHGVAINGERFRETAKAELKYLFTLNPDKYDRPPEPGIYFNGERLPESETSLVMKGKNAERKAWFWFTKIFSVLLVVSIAWGIFNFPLGAAYSAVAENFGQGLNVSRWRALSKNLTEDYGRVFFYWLCFLLLFAGTVYLEIKFGGGKIKDRSRFFYVVQFLLTVFRLYLLYVLATMLGKMLYRNRLAVRN